MKDYNEIKNELLDAKTEPIVTLWIDDKGDIFWVTSKGKYIWLFQDGHPSSFVDDAHKEVEQQSTPESVGSVGTWWKNTDLEAPFHISDFISRIEEISGSAYYENLQNELIEELKSKN